MSPKTYVPKAHTVTLYALQYHSGQIFRRRCHCLSHPSRRKQSPQTSAAYCSPRLSKNHILVKYPINAFYALPLFSICCQALLQQATLKQHSSLLCQRYCLFPSHSAQASSAAYPDSQIQNLYRQKSLTAYLSPASSQNQIFPSAHKVFYALQKQQNQ